MDRVRRSAPLAWARSWSGQSRSATASRGRWPAGERQTGQHGHRLAGVEPDGPPSRRTAAGPAAGSRSLPRPRGSLVRRRPAVALRNDSGTRERDGGPSWLRTGGPGAGTRARDSRDSSQRADGRGDRSRRARAARGVRRQAPQVRVGPVVGADRGRGPRGAGQPGDLAQRVDLGPGRRRPAVGGPRPGLPAHRPGDPGPAAGEPDRLGPARRSVSRGRSTCCSASTRPWGSSCVPGRCPGRAPSRPCTRAPGC